MYSLKQTPIFLKFLNRVIGSINNKPYLKTDIENNFSIIHRCRCNQKDCATVTLKSKIKLEDIELSNNLKVHRGFIHLCILSDYILEVECIDYKEFPYKNELCKLVKSQGEPTEIYSRYKHKKKKLSKDSIKSLNSFFNKKISLYEKQFKVGIDENVIYNKKLFCHVR